MLTAICHEHPVNPILLNSPSPLRIRHVPYMTGDQVTHQVRVPVSMYMSNISKPQISFFFT